MLLRFQHVGLSPKHFLSRYCEVWCQKTVGHNSIRFELSISSFKLKSSTSFRGFSMPLSFHLFSSVQRPSLNILVCIPAKNRHTFESCIGCRILTKADIIGSPVRNINNVISILVYVSLLAGILFINDDSTKYVDKLQTTQSPETVESLF